MIVEGKIEMESVDATRAASDVCVPLAYSIFALTPFCLLSVPSVILLVFRAFPHAGKIRYECLTFKKSLRNFLFRPFKTVKP